MGPAMASGSHTCSGNCADLPTAPKKINRAITASKVPPSLTAVATASAIPSNSKVRAWRKMSMIPMSMPMSPTRVVKYAFIAAKATLRLLVPVPDQQVGAQADQLPEDEEQEEVVGQYQAQHRRR